MRFLLIFTFFAFIFLSQAQEKKSPFSKNSFEISFGTSGLVRGATGSNTYTINSTRRDTYADLFNFDLAYFRNFQKEETRFSSLGLCYTQWIYTVKRTYVSYKTSDKWGYDRKDFDTRSNEFTILRSQLTLQLKKNFVLRPKLLMNVILGAGCVFPCKSASEPLHYSTSGSHFSPYVGTSSYYQKYDTTDVVKEGTTPILHMGGGISYQVFSNAFLFVEPGILISSFREAAGLAFIGQVKFGYRHNF